LKKAKKTEPGIETQKIDLEKTMNTEGGYSRKEFLEYIISRLVDAPNEVQVNMTEGQNTIVFEVRVADGDLGKVIGKKGQNINAVQTLLNIIGGREKSRSIIELLK